MFEVGQKVICISSQRWKIGKGPRKEEVLRIMKFCDCGLCKNHLIFEKYTIDNAYDKVFFKPLIEDWLEEALEKAEKEYKEEENELTLEALGLKIPLYKTFNCRCR